MWPAGLPIGHDTHETGCHDERSQPQSGYGPFCALLPVPRSSYNLT